MLAGAWPNVEVGLTTARHCVEDGGSRGGGGGGMDTGDKTTACEEDADGRRVAVVVEETADGKESGIGRSGDVGALLVP
jgi:NADH:ubiquinone oxidoreductase subunit F (NADH-binding)